MAISLFCLLLIAFASLILLGKKIKRSKWNLPPSPPKFPVIGNLHQLGELPHRSLQRLAERTGHVMLLHLGFVPVTVISSKEAAEEVLRTHDLDCCSRPKLVGTRLISRGFKDVGFTPYGEEWKERRKFLVREFFCLKKVQSFGYIREEECNFLVKKLSESAVDRTPVDMSKTLFWLTASILFRVASGQSFHESKFIDKDKVDELVFEAETAQASFTCSDFFPIAGLGWIVDCISGQHKRLKDVFFKLDALFQGVIDDHLHPGRRSEDHRDIVDIMLDVMHKQGKDISLKLTINNIKGILTVQGYNIPPKTRILVNAWAIGRDPKVWTNPEEFNPERFINSPLDYSGQHFELLPFGSGRRVCPGMAMGMATVELGLLNLLYFFDWKLPDGMTHKDIDTEEAGTLTIVKKVPLKLVPVRVQ
ncbi:predicted protein [Arabidopsis lyrata subsp. lyrata]|uniref:Predicted protein n=1 Tax=Arabidopsis lyrata subsp. lyrata TaxID=81972 RepID=D7LR24_ARALL|nr:predicted protein [Arabidopsis lyrata subsp. lyrata]